MNESSVCSSAIPIKQYIDANDTNIQRVAQLYQVLTYCKHAIARSMRKADLFDEICRVAVVFGGMQMAWIGLVDDDKVIRPASFYGDGLDYLDNLQVTSSTDDPHSLGPAGLAVHTRRPIWNQSFINDPQTSPWHDSARKFGWQSVAGLPLNHKGDVIGVLMLYSLEAEAFDRAARSLLIEMASDISFALDNIEREQARQRAESQLRLAAKVFEQSSEGFMITDADNRIVMINKAFCDITGYGENEVLGSKPSLLSSGHQNSAFYQSMWDAISSTGYWQGEVLNRKKNGQLFLVRLSVSRIKDPNGGASQYIGTFSDITKYKATEERVNWLTHFDTLTGLPNRNLLEDRCRHAISMAQRSSSGLALMFLDIDNFKSVNEALGFRAGDALISLLGRNLKSIVCEQDTVSRVGGDDFVILLPNTDANEAAHLAKKVLEKINLPHHVEQQEIRISASIGIAVYPDNGHDLDSLSRCAEAAMYRAKNEGRNTFRFFNRTMQEHAFRTLQLENALRCALEKEQFQLHYQPQVCLATGRVVSAEALLRWTSPELGSVSPAEFIPVAESTSLILPIGEWVLRTATQQMKTWLDQGRPLSKIAVNISPVQFRQPRLPDMIMLILAETGLPAHCLELELTESVAMEDPAAAMAIVEELRRRGIRVSIDDFGTGHSSLAHLKRFKASKIKIDRSFVRDVARNPEDKAIVSAIINLAANLELHTLAEGVETEEQIEFLRSQGCNEAQGYYFSRPVPAGELEPLLESGCFLAHR